MPAEPGVSGRAGVASPCNCGGPVGDAELRVDVFEVLGDRALAERELERDLRVRQPERDELQHLALARGQPGGT
jgi:hypothetical protein